MMLNPECIRDILLTVEENSNFNHVILYVPSDNHNKFPRFQSYPPDEVLYHIKQCEFSGLLYISTWLLTPGVTIKDLSPKGHEFLANIREDTNWNKTKEVAKKVGSESLSVLAQIAGQVISNLISKI